MYGNMCSGQIETQTLPPRACCLLANYQQLPEVLFNAVFVSIWSHQLTEQHQVRTGATREVCHQVRDWGGLSVDKAVFCFWLAKYKQLAKVFWF